MLPLISEGVPCHQQHKGSAKRFSTLNVRALVVGTREAPEAVHLVFRPLSVPGEPSLCVGIESAATDRAGVPRPAAEGGGESPYAISLVFCPLSVPPKHAPYTPEPDTQVSMDEQ